MKASYYLHLKGKCRIDACSCAGISLARVDLRFRVWGVGVGVQGSGFMDGFRVQGAGCRVQGAGFRVQGAGCRVQSSGFRVQGSRFTVHG